MTVKNDIAVIDSVRMTKALECDYPHIPKVLIEGSVQRAFAVNEGCSIRVITFEAIKDLEMIIKRKSKKETK